VSKNIRVLEAEFLEGKFLKKVRDLTYEELKIFGWEELPQAKNSVAFVFEDGTVIIPTDFDGVMPGIATYLRDFTENE
jgi:hypothetical protein